MESAVPSTSMCNRPRTRSRPTRNAGEVMAEIFHDSDSGDSSDDSDSDDFEPDDTESQSQLSDETDEVQQHLLQRGKGKATKKKLEFMWKDQPIQPTVYPFTGMSEINAYLLSLLSEELTQTT